nr:hypothetical protein [Laribacter hongkongensis]
MKLSTESKRIVDTWYWSSRVARASDYQCSKIEHPTKNALIDLDALNFFQLQLDRFSADKAKFCDNTLVCDCQLSR